MRFIVLFLLFKGLQVKGLDQMGSTTKLTGYVGESIVLPGNPPDSWTLVRIDWSILYNNTWIATWDRGIINTKRRPEYKGRLTLDTLSANLTITNLQLRDAMIYYVDIFNKTNFNRRNQVHLTVKVRLMKPTIQLYQNFTPSENGCVLVLNCSSPDPGVTFAWKVNPTCHHCSNNSLNSSSELIAFFLTTPDSVNLTCIVMDESQSTSNVLISKMKVPRFEPPPDCGFMFAWGFFTTLLIVIVVTSLFHFREHITNTFQCGRTGGFNPSPGVQAQNVISQK